MSARGPDPRPRRETEPEARPRRKTEAEARPRRGADLVAGLGPRPRGADDGLEDEMAGRGAARPRRRAGPDLDALACRLGHAFADPSLLDRALTHSSALGEARGAPAASNERLEFLGDRVLALAMAEALLAQDPGAPEGRIAPRFNALVRRETCADVARAIGLGEALRLGRSEARSGGRRKEALLGDAMEAVIAAVYRDAGFEAARALVARLWGERIGRVEADARDAKTALQEWAQARGEAPPDYPLVAREGPDHAPAFTIEARLADGRSARARAGSKREAEQAAARALLDAVTGARRPADGGDGGGAADG